uniref:Cytosol aminopeptidase n=1 Tax=Timema poppense TaxID=170557 RepID=A0A7R9H0P8_TIMPO|nr:unnamed protein product [Timema poppensis]
MACLLVSSLKTKVLSHVPRIGSRFITCDKGGKKAVVVGMYSDDGTGSSSKLTPVGEQVNQLVGGKLNEVLAGGGPRKYQVHVWEGEGEGEEEVSAVAVVGLGREDEEFDPQENYNQAHEKIRRAVGIGARRLSEEGYSHLLIDGCDEPGCAAEGVGLALRYLEPPESGQAAKYVLEHFGDTSEEFQQGLFKAQAQNLARNLLDNSSLHSSPHSFAQASAEALCPLKVGVEVYDKTWLEKMKMEGFLTAAKGSCEPPYLMKIHYNGGGKSIAIIGQGVTFNTGAASLKTCLSTSEFRTDMAGAAVVVGVMRGAATLQLPVNLTAIVPLCENMVSGMSMKQGDVILSMDNHTVQVECSSQAGRLAMADALYYSCSFRPSVTIDVATTTHDFEAVLGSSCSSVFTNNDDLWVQLCQAGCSTGDRVWRFPLWKHFDRSLKGLCTP